MVSFNSGWMSAVGTYKTAGSAAIAALLIVGIAGVGGSPAQGAKPLPGELFFGNGSSAGGGNTPIAPPAPGQVHSRHGDKVWNVAGGTHGFWASPYMFLTRPLCSAKDATAAKRITAGLRRRAAGGGARLVSLLLSAAGHEEASSGLRRKLLIAAGAVVNKGDIPAACVQKFAAAFYPAFSGPTLAQASAQAEEMTGIVRAYARLARAKCVALTVDSWANLAELQVRAGQFHRAAASLKNAGQFAALLPSRRQPEVQEHLDRVAALVKDGVNFAAELPSLERLLTTHPESPQANRKLAVASLTLLENIPLAAKFAPYSGQKWLVRMAADYSRAADNPAPSINLQLADDLAHIGLARRRRIHRFAICSFAHRSLGRMLVLEDLTAGQSADVERQLNSLARAMKQADPAGRR